MFNICSYNEIVLCHEYIVNNYFKLFAIFFLKKAIPSNERSYAQLK